MRRLVLTLFAALCATAAWGQEVVVFKSYRALAVQSHRVQGKWTYLRLPEGEVAVLTATIQEYRKEPAAPAAPVTSAPAQSGRGYKPEPAPPPPPEPPPPEPEEQMPQEEPPPPEDPGQQVKPEQPPPNVARKPVD